MFESIYGSSYHHPYSFFAFGIPLLAYFVWQARRWRLAEHPSATLRYHLALTSAAFQLLILSDAWLTAPKLSPLGGGLAEAVAIGFVIVGDARYFLLLERYGKGRGPARAASLALAWSLVVPVGSLAAKAFTSNGRVLFLTYELSFAILAAALGLRVVRRLPEGPGRTFAARLTAFEFAQYVLWASADVLILQGVDAGFLLRLVPNTIYYVAFVPFAWRAAPSELHA